jgi:hypothetical protein
MQTIRETTTQAFQTRSEALLTANTPLVIRGLISHWPAVELAQSSPEHFVTQLGQTAHSDPVTAFILEPEHQGRVFYNSNCTDFNFSTLRVPLIDAIAKLLEFNQAARPSTLYVGSMNIDHWLPQFALSNRAPVELAGSLASLWLGNKSTIAAHFDFPDNLACVVAGRRRFTLLPPAQLPNLYVGPLDLTPAGQPISMVDFRDPDFARFPRFEQALTHAFQATLEPGDAIVIPSMWWHHVESLDNLNTLVNYWWRQNTVSSGPPLAALQHAMLAFKDLAPHQKQAWQALLNFYVFEQDGTRFEHIPEPARGVLNPLTPSMASRIKAMIRQLLK